MVQVLHALESAIPTAVKAAPVLIVQDLCAVICATHDVSSKFGLIAELHPASNPLLLLYPPQQIKRKGSESSIFQPTSQGDDPSDPRKRMRINQPMQDAANPQASGVPPSNKPELFAPGHEAAQAMWMMSQSIPVGPNPTPSRSEAAPPISTTTTSGVGGMMQPYQVARSGAPPGFQQVQFVMPGHSEAASQSQPQPTPTAPMLYSVDQNGHLVPIHPGMISQVSQPYSMQGQPQMQPQPQQAQRQMAVPTAAPSVGQVVFTSPGGNTQPAMMPMTQGVSTDGNGNGGYHMRPFVAAQVLTNLASAHQERSGSAPQFTFASQVGSSSGLDRVWHPAAVLPQAVAPGVNPAAAAAAASSMNWPSDLRMTMAETRRMANFVVDWCLRHGELPMFGKDAENLILSLSSKQVNEAEEAGLAGEGEMRRWRKVLQNCDPGTAMVEQRRRRGASKQTPLRSLMNVKVSEHWSYKAKLLFKRLGVRENTGPTLNRDDVMKGSVISNISHWTGVDLEDLGPEHVVLALWRANKRVLGRNLRDDVQAARRRVRGRRVEISEFDLARDGWREELNELHSQLFPDNDFSALKTGRRNAQSSDSQPKAGQGGGALAPVRTERWSTPRDDRSVSDETPSASTSQFTGTNGTSGGGGGVGRATSSTPSPSPRPPNLTIQQPNTSVVRYVAVSTAMNPEKATSSTTSSSHDMDKSSKIPAFTKPLSPGNGTPGNGTPGKLDASKKENVSMTNLDLHIPNVYSGNLTPGPLLTPSTDFKFEGSEGMNFSAFYLSTGTTPGAAGDENYALSGAWSPPPALLTPGSGPLRPTTTTDSGPSSMTEEESPDMTSATDSAGTPSGASTGPPSRLRAANAHNMRRDLGILSPGTSPFSPAM